MLNNGVNEERKAAVLEALENMDQNTLLAAWDEYARENRPDDEIFTWDEFDELFGDQPATWVIDRIYYGDYNPDAELLTFNGYGNIVSVFWSNIESYMDFDDMATWYADAPSWAYVPDEIAEKLAELDEAEEDEQTA